MSSFSFSRSALEKITNDTKAHAAFRGERLRPLLLQYAESYSTSSTGEKVDCGAGMILHFRSADDEIEDAYLGVTAGRNLTVFFAPLPYARLGAWVIDYRDHTFVLDAL